MYVIEFPVFYEELFGRIKESFARISHIAWHHLFFTGRYRFKKVARSYVTYLLLGPKRHGLEHSNRTVYSQALRAGYRECPRTPGYGSLDDRMMRELVAIEGLKQVIQCAYCITVIYPGLQ